MNKYKVSSKIFDEALKYMPRGIPGHQGPCEAGFVPIEAYPLFCEKSKGAYFYDKDNNKFIDLVSSYGANILGYNDADIINEVNKQIQLMNNGSIPSDKIVELAKLFVNNVNCADWCFMTKNGNDSTTFAIMIAREATQRKKILSINKSMHGYSPWCQNIDNCGVIQEDVNNSLYIPFNDLSALEKVFDKYKGEIAGFISSPYYQAKYNENFIPEKGYWQEVRKLCTKHGVVLILDDVYDCMRLDLSGSDHYYDFEADLICYGNAISNGWGLAMIGGKQFLKTTASAITYSGNCWLNAVPVVAGITCLNKCLDNNIVKSLRELGIYFSDSLVNLGSNYDIEVSITGEPSMLRIKFKNDDDFKIQQIWNSECVKRGLFISSVSNNFLNFSLNNKILDDALNICEDSFKAIKKA